MGSKVKEARKSEEEMELQEKSGEEKLDETKEVEELPPEGEKDDGVTGECETGQSQDIEETAHLDPEEKDIQLHGETEETVPNEEETGCQDETSLQDEIGDEDERVKASAE